MEKLPKAYSIYGASLGRRSSWVDHDIVGKVRLCQVRLDSGGYDNGGAYWGHGLPLWMAEDSEGNQKFFRAANRDIAKSLLPGCKFYR